MAGERRNGVGSRLSGVLERANAAPPDRLVESDEPGPTPEPIESEPGEPAAPPRRAGGASPRKSRTLEARAAKRVKGRTVYLNDDLFERLLVQSHRRDMTISDYVASILERSVPDHRQVVRPGPGEEAA